MATVPALQAGAGQRKQGDDRDSDRGVGDHHPGDRTHAGSVLLAGATSAEPASHVDRAEDARGSNTRTRARRRTVDHSPALHLRAMDPGSRPQHSPAVIPRAPTLLEALLEMRCEIFPPLPFSSPEPAKSSGVTHIPERHIYIKSTHSADNIVPRIPSPSRPISHTAPKSPEGNGAGACRLAARLIADSSTDRKIDLR